MSKDSIEVLFLGTSHTFHGIDPMYIYENSGITSFAISGSGLRIDLTYLSLEEALKTQSPTTVFLDMSAIHWKGQPKEARAHKVLDQFGWSLTKLEYVFNNGIKDMEPLDVLFPLLRYHTRWTELDSTDFKYLTNDLDETFIRGHFIEYRSVTAKFNFEEEKEFSLTSRNRKYLDRIVELCSENNIELIFYKIPSPGWFRAYSEGAEALAEEYGLTYLELYYKMDEIGLDIYTDFRDSYDHLNQYGAEKLCSYLIGYMQNNCEVTDQRETNQEWNEDLESYRKLLQEVKEYQLQE